MDWSQKKRTFWFVLNERTNERMEDRIGLNETLEGGSAEIHEYRRTEWRGRKESSPCARHTGREKPFSLYVLLRRNREAGNWQEVDLVWSFWTE